MLTWAGSPVLSSLAPNCLGGSRPTAYRDQVCGPGIQSRFRCLHHPIRTLPRFDRKGQGAGPVPCLFRLRCCRQLWSWAQRANRHLNHLRPSFSRERIETPARPIAPSGLLLAPLSNHRSPLSAWDINTLSMDMKASNPSAPAAQRVPRSTRARVGTRARGGLGGGTYGKNSSCWGRQREGLSSPPRGRQPYVGRQATRGFQPTVSYSW